MKLKLISHKVVESLLNHNVLYHSTSYDSAIKILQSNVLRVGKGSKIRTKYDELGAQAVLRNRVSLTRSLQFARSYLSGTRVVLVINRDKLASDYHIEPSSDRNSTGHQMVGRKSPRDKYEELVYEDIDNITKYLDKIIVYDDTSNLSDEDINELKNLSGSIPVEVVK